MCIKLCKECGKERTNKNNVHLCGKCHYIRYRKNKTKHKPCPICGKLILFESFTCVDCGHKKRIGVKVSPETRKRMSEAQKGKFFSEATRKKISERQKGRHMSEETKIKIGEAHKGEKHWTWGKPRPEETRQKISKALTGVKLSEERKKNIGNAGRGKKQSEERRRRRSEASKGNKTHLWKGGINPINDTIRKGVDYKIWRESVFKRDNWTCRECGNRGGRLDPHHIKPFAFYPELRFNIDNGLTLCHDCHKKTPNYGRSKLNIN